MTSEHIEQKVLRAYTSGELTRAETARVVAHLATCDECLAYVDSLWAADPLTIETDPHELDPAVAQAMQARLFKRIHRANLGANVARLGTEGFMNVFLALLRPLMDMSGSSKQKGSKS